MAQTSYQLSQGFIKSVTTDYSKCKGKHYLCQAYNVKIMEEGEKLKISMNISDGVNSIRAITIVTQKIQEFDVVILTEFRTQQKNETLVLCILQLIPAFTNITSLLGSPVDYKTINPNEKNISSNIPAAAQQEKGANGKLEEFAIKAPAQVEKPIHKTQPEIPKVRKSLLNKTYRPSEFQQISNL